MKEINIENNYEKSLISPMILDNKLNVKFNYKSDFKSTKALRDFIEESLTLFNFEKKWISRIILISDELNNNAIEYWSSEWDMNSMILMIDWNNIIIEVTDTGNWKEAKTSKEMEDLRINRLNKWFDNHSSIRWRWLFMIITRLVDDLYFKDTKSWWLIVWIKKTL